MARTLKTHPLGSKPRVKGTKRVKAFPGAGRLKKVKQVMIQIILVEMREYKTCCQIPKCFAPCKYHYHNIIPHPETTYPQTHHRKQLMCFWLVSVSLVASPTINWVFDASPKTN